MVSPDAGVEVRVHGIGAGGAGVGRLPDGRVVFVHRTAPGERARIRVTSEKKSWARGRLVEIIDRAPERREPPCPHYDRCGGCTLEHLTYPAQLHWKGRILADALERIGGLSVDPPEVRASPREVRYRSRITLTLRRPEGDRVVAGFHELEEPDRIVDLGGECLLPDPEIGTVLDRLRDAWGPGARLLPAGEELRLTLRRVREGVVLVVSGGRGSGDPDSLLDRVEGLVSIWRNGEAGSRRLAGREEVTERVLGEVVPVRGGAFLQVNREAGDALHRRVLELLDPPAGRRIVDAYCGVGVVGRILARGGARVTGIELDPDAVRCARRGAPEGLDVLEGAVEDRLSETLPADVVLLNPPRTGLHDRIPEILLRSGPPRVVYVSCDPATLARDAKRLAEGYGLATLDAFDLFPQTAHVESVAVFESRED